MFHTDCIGSAFNAKKRMECPCCRQIEQGQWLYAKGLEPSIEDFNLDDVLDQIQGVHIRSTPPTVTDLYIDFFPNCVVLY